MMFALDKNPMGVRIEPQPGLIGVCPGCLQPMLAKCGEINVWHWSHESLRDCDIWYESETAWHVGWKRIVKPEFCEVVMSPHRADIAVPKPLVKRMVIELQNSTISPEVIREREQFYRNMIWLFNAETFAKNIELRPKWKGKEIELDGCGNDWQTGKPPEIPADYFTFRWKHPRKSLYEIRRPLYLDFSMDSYYQDKPMIFHVRKLYGEVPCGGWGVFLTREEFINQWIPKEARR